MPKNASDGRWSVRAPLPVQNTLKINLVQEKEADVVQRFRGKGAFIQASRQQDARAAAGSETAQNPAEGSPRVGGNPNRLARRDAPLQEEVGESLQTRGL